MERHELSNEEVQERTAAGIRSSGPYVGRQALHATPNIANTLRRIHSLLKTNGKLALIEPCNLTTVRIPFIFGLLWWWLSSEHYRYWGLLLSPDGWVSGLQDAGFKGADLSSPDFEDHRHTMSMVISTAIKAPEPVPDWPFQQVVVLAANQASREHPLVVPGPRSSRTRS
ncbi:hypothetical protein BJX99DRAFT_255533 [Aspergillus californicus]